MVAASAALGILTIAGLTIPWLPLLLTFALGLGAVMNDPAWQAITPEIISRDQHVSAVALNSARLNMARAARPALRGAVIAPAGAGADFLVNSACLFAVI